MAQDQEADIDNKDVVLAEPGSHPFPDADPSKIDAGYNLTGEAGVDHDALRIIKLPQSKWVRRYRGVVFQMIVLALLAFSGPSMSNAISGLGGGGLATPYTANAASATQYSVSTVIAMLGGPLVGILGIPVCCLIGLYGVTSAFLYEKCLLYHWSAISLALNINKSGGGGVSVETYLAFLGMECLGVPFAFLLSPTRKVIRDDGYGVPVLPKKSWKKELKLLWEHHKQPRTLLLIPIFILTYFGDGVWGTYMSLHFSVRGRALSTLVNSLGAVVVNLAFSRILDTKRFGPRRKANLAFWTFTIPALAMLIWVMINLHWFGTKPASLRLDYGSTPGRFVSAWFPHFIYATMSWASQTLVYWVLGQFASDMTTNARTGGVFRSWETVGQAVSYGINAHSGNKYVPFGIYFGLYVISMPLFWIVLQTLPTETKRPNIQDENGQIVEMPEPTK
ncbi:uncharacterized protein L199_001042 [Kwoniella botswanensis]|uniref:uncharacterized protein n=1 Tax=Kwoniella botswanensis TaxID=1268659 RepID=UPI00315D03C9